MQTLRRSGHLLGLVVAPIVDDRSELDFQRCPIQQRRLAAPLDIRRAALVEVGVPRNDRLLQQLPTLTRSLLFLLMLHRTSG